ncbi:MAG TPA: Crp/Fnr family transcriptional regulator [Candidatus Dormibacteraeota bacterium]|nr:Crp/Fnr family transcriptional regulator [Candidatus Dormibacteraeota bacterium]
MPQGILGLQALRSLARRKPEASMDTSPAAFKQEFLRKIDIFRDLNHEEIEQIDRQTRMTTVRKGHVIYHQEDRAEGLFLLKRGRVRLSRLSPSGKKLELAVLEPGTFFGELSMLGVSMRNASAEAVDDSLLCVMSEADVERLVLSKPQVGLRMIGILGRRLAAAEARLEDFAYRSASSRVAAALLRMSNDGAIEGVSHQDLADAVGAYRETVTKILDEFEAAGLVALGRRRLEVLDAEALKRRCAS